MNLPPLDPPATAEECRKEMAEVLNWIRKDAPRPWHRGFILRAHALAEMAKRLEREEAAKKTFAAEQESGWPKQLPSQW